MKTTNSYITVDLFGNETEHKEETKRAGQTSLHHIIWSLSENELNTIEQLNKKEQNHANKRQAEASR